MVKKKPKTDYARKFRAIQKKKGLVLKKKPSKKRGVKFTYSWGKPSKRITRKTKLRKAKAPSTKYEWVKKRRAEMKLMGHVLKRVPSKKRGVKFHYVYG